MKRILLIFIVAAVLFSSLAACGGGEAEITPSPSPTPLLTPTPDPIEVRAEQLLSEMTLNDKLCQLIVVRPEALTGEEAVTECGELMSEALAQWPLGGIIFSLDNLVTKDQTVAMIDGIQELCKLKMLICADEEGGNVGRLMYKLGTTFFHDMYSYKDKGEDTAYSNAYTIAKDMRSCHFNTDFAPVADVWTNPDNTVIAGRAYSDDYDEAAKLVAAAVRGFSNGGVVCCLKHFPGHGDTAEDSHVSAAVSERTMDQLMSGELLPFVSGMAAGADMIMVGHIIVPSLDDKPASVSYKLVTELLRRGVGYEGVVVTDGLEMGALGDITDAEKAVQCIAAGDDILLGITDIQGAVEGLEAAIDSGELTESRIDESVRRILILKLKNGIIS